MKVQFTLPLAPTASTILANLLKDALAPLLLLPTVVPHHHMPCITQRHGHLCKHFAPPVVSIVAMRQDDAHVLDVVVVKVAGGYRQKGLHVDLLACNLQHARRGMYACS